jgi:hypothetical protein
MADKNKEALQSFVKDEITHFFEKVLDFAEVAIGDKNVYKSFRAKVLRLGNNAIRATSKEIDMNYTVKWDPQVKSEDIIEIKR